MSAGKTLFKVHSILGLVSGLFILLISLTGMFIVFYDEIDQLLYSDILSATPVGRRMSLHEAYLKASHQYPGYNAFRISHGILDKKQSIEVGFQKDGFAEKFSVYVNPYNGHLSKVESTLSSILLKLHYTFYLGKIGELLVTIFSISLLGSIITGAIVYKQQIIKVLLFKVKIKFRNSRLAMSGLHCVLGVWALLFNIVWAFSGFWMMKSTFNLKHHFSDHKAEKSKKVKIAVSIDSLLSQSQQKIQGVTVHYIALPKTSEDPITFYGDTPGNFLLGEGGNSLTYNASTGQPLNMKREDDLSFSEKFDETVYSLHFGKFGGLLTKVIYSLFGFFTAVVSLSGYFLWWKRFKS